jgi:hypothetical protein
MAQVGKIVQVKFADSKKTYAYDDAGLRTVIGDWVRVPPPPETDAVEWHNVRPEGSIGEVVGFGRRGHDEGGYPSWYAGNTVQLVALLPPTDATYAEYMGYDTPEPPKLVFLPALSRRVASLEERVDRLEQGFTVRMNHGPAIRVYPGDELSLDLPDPRADAIKRFKRTGGF